MSRSAGAAPFGTFERLLVRRYLSGRRRDGFISIIAAFSLIGIALGVGTLIIVMSVMNGFRIQLVERVLGVNPHVTVFADGDGFEEVETLVARITGLPGVERVSPRIERQVLAFLGGRSAGVLVRAIPPADLAALPAVADTPELIQGSVAGFLEEGGLALGDGLAARLGAGPGDEVTLIWPEGDRTPFGLAPRVRRFQVTYVFKIGLSHFDRQLAFLPFEEGARFFGTESPDFLEVTLTEPELSDLYRRRIAEAWDRPLRMSDWQSSNSTYFQALEVERNVMFLILTLIILVAALNIVSGMIMLVKEKLASIAILRGMGASAASVMRIFFMCGASIGVVGTAAGVLLGVVFCLNIESIQEAVTRLSGTQVFNPDIYFLSRLPAELRMVDVLGVTGFSLVVSFLATLYPSWRAARTDPVEVLRHA